MAEPDITEGKRLWDYLYKVSVLSSNLKEKAMRLLPPYNSIINSSDGELKWFATLRSLDISDAIQVANRGERFAERIIMDRFIMDENVADELIEALEFKTQRLSRPEVTELASSHHDSSMRRLNIPEIDRVVDAPPDEYEEDIMQWRPRQLVPTSTVHFNAKKLTKAQRRAISRKALKGWKNQFYKGTYLESSGGRHGKKKRKSRSTPANLYY